MANVAFGARLQAAAKIHRLILTGKYPNATALARESGLHVRTVRKQFAILRDSFAYTPKYDPLRHGYYYPEQQKPALMPRLSGKEVVAVFLLEEAARSLAGSPVGELLDSVLGKLTLMLPADTPITMDDMAAAFSLRAERSSASGGADPGILATIFGALTQRNRLQIKYRGQAQQKPSTRKIDPLHLTRCEGQWYLVAYCQLRKAIRTFVPARMLAAHVLSEAFVPPKDFDPKTHFQTAFGIVAGKAVAPVTLKFWPPVAQIIRERTWHATQQLEECSGNCVRLRMTCSQSDELRSWIMGWGENVMVESPADLASDITASHRRAARRMA